MNRQEEILRVLAPGLRAALRPLSSLWDGVEEIRLRVGQPLAVTFCGRSVFVTDHGRICNGDGKLNDDSNCRGDGKPDGDSSCWGEKLHRVTLEEIRDTMNLLSSYSRYAFEDKIRQGFLTIQGGHRVGLAGRVILDQTTGRGLVKTIAPITFLNIRIARQVIGCAESVLPWLWRKGEAEEHGKWNGQGAGQFYDTLLISSPGMGKTTLLRDMIRLLSYQGMTVGVVDERSELAACHQGIPQNDLGPRTDVLDGCSKADGMMMMVRTMTPQILAVDEVGTEEDHYALEYAMHCGSRMLATAHGSSWDEIRQRPILGRWLAEGRFGRYVLIEREIADKNSRYRYRVCDGTGKVITTVQSRS